jgi:hypothetical protein
MSVRDVTPEELHSMIAGVVNVALGSNTKATEASFLPFPKVRVEPHRTEFVVARPQLPFRGAALWTWAPSARHFDIEDLRVGTRAMGVAPGSFAADLLAVDLQDIETYSARVDQHGFVHAILIRESATRFGIDMPLAGPGQDIALTVTNRDDEARIFEGSLVLGVIEWNELPRPTP